MDNKNIGLIAVIMIVVGIAGLVFIYGVNPELGGYGDMMDDGTDIKTLENAKPFDKEFIEQMIPHHQMAIMMATMLLEGTDREEMKTLALAIIDAQSREIDQMRSWYRSWYGG